jgi:hypothetical protein
MGSKVLTGKHEADEEHEMTSKRDHKIKMPFSCFHSLPVFLLKMGSNEFRLPAGQDTV